MPSQRTGREQQVATMLLYVLDVGMVRILDRLIHMMCFLTAEMYHLNKRTIGFCIQVTLGSTGQITEGAILTDWDMDVELGSLRRESPKP